MNEETINYFINEGYYICNFTYYNKKMLVLFANFLINFFINYIKI